MKAAIPPVFEAFSMKFEGRLAHFYLDVLGWVTIGVGNKMDPREGAMGLMMVRADGTRAGWPEIAMAWDAVDAKRTAPKGQPQPGSLAQHGGAVFASVTTLRLTEHAISELVRARLTSVDSVLSAQLRGYVDWCADAQLGAISMAYAMGTRRLLDEFPHWQAAARAGDWAKAADESHMDDAHNPGLRPRNAENRQLFLNAADSVTTGGDPERLYWPGTVPPITVREIPVATG